jgi:N-sulfoglucosamine sulfohydrolase
MGDDEYRYYKMSFGKRPAEELYDVTKDSDCVHDLAADAKLADTKDRRWQQLRQELAEQGDPRIVADGDIFDAYPNCRVDRQQKLYGQPDFDPVKAFNEKFGTSQP